MTGFWCQQSVADRAIYFWKEKGWLIISIDYVDGILLFYKDDSATAEITRHFKESFEIRIDGWIKKCSSFSVEDVDKRNKLHNALMIRRLLNYLR